MHSGQSLALRAVAALLLMVVFFASALAVAAALAWLGIEVFSRLGDVQGLRALLAATLMAAACLAAAGVILWSLLPRIDHFEAPGPELAETEAPALFDEIRSIAAATGQAAPAHVYAVDDVNAFVTERGGVMGVGSKRVMGLGLPLLEVLTLGELRAVIAHEFGHFHGGDTKLGPWIYKTRAAVGRTIVNLARAHEATAEFSHIFGFVMGIVRAPFGWFGTVFMRITQAISRAQEHGADALAARVVGSAPLAEGLKKVHAASFAYRAYFENEVAPMFEAGYRPPIAEGYRRFARVERTASAMATAVEDELRDGEQDEFDSHPPLRERVTAAAALAMPAVRDDGRAALGLIADVDRLEARIAAHMVSESHRLAAIAWEDTAARVLEPSWRKRLADDGPALAGLEAASLPRDHESLRKLAEAASGATLDRVPLEDLRDWATGLFGTAITTALLDRGWTASNDPGAPIVLRLDEASCEPFVEVRDYLIGTTEPEAWAARAATLGLGGVAFG